MPVDPYYATSRVDVARTQEDFSPTAKTERQQAAAGPHTRFD